MVALNLPFKCCLNLWPQYYTNKKKRVNSTDMLMITCSFNLPVEIFHLVVVEAFLCSIQLVSRVVCKTILECCTTQLLPVSIFVQSSDMVILVQGEWNKVNHLHIFFMIALVCVR